MGKLKIAEIVVLAAAAIVTAAKAIIKFIGYIYALAPKEEPIETS